MKPNIKETIKSNHPNIYKALSKCRRSPNALKEGIKYPFKLAGYSWCKYTNRPYLGSIMVAAQSSEVRRLYMKKSVELGIKNLSRNEFKILEIGSWAGHSAIYWAEILKQLKVDGLVICVDPWRPYFDTTGDIGASPVPLLMERALKNNKIYNLFLHNIKSAGHSDVVKPYRGDSDEVLPTLRDDGFNLVYIDGSHFYSQVIKDLHNCGRLITEGGFMCGDDLEMQAHEVDKENAKEKKEQDYILDPKTNDFFHPGVTLAVAEYFKCEVSCFEGFWIMQKTKSGWEKVDLSAK